MSYAYDSSHTAVHRQSGRQGKRPTTITIHHWGKRGQQFDNVVRFLCSRRPDNPSSAHYVVQDGRVSCIVDPDDTAFHAGVWARNLDSIGIECRPEATDGDYRTVAELVRNLRAIYGNLPLRRHSDWKNTQCPGVWDLARIDRESRSVPVAGPVVPAPAPAPAKPKPIPEPEGLIFMKPYVVYANTGSAYYLVTPGSPKPYATRILAMNASLRKLDQIEIGNETWETFKNTVTFV